MRTHRHKFSARLALVAAATLIVVPAVGARGPATELPIANEQLGGTVLSITPGIGFDSAELRVTGPDGYALARHFDAGTPITVDLVADAKHTDGDQAGNAAANTERASAPTALPDGAYRYEVVVATPTGESAAHSGHFVVRNGTPTNLESTSARPDPSVDHSGRTTTIESASASPEPSPQNLNADNLVQVLDAVDDGMTHIFLESDETSTPPSNWHIRNDFGDIRFREFPGSGNFDRLALVAGGNVGIGTTTPLRPLNVSGFFPQFRSDHPSPTDWEFGHGGVGFWFDRTGAGGVLKMQNNAPTNALVVSGSGVGIGTGSPVADIDVNEITGNGITNIRFAVGSHSWTNAVTSGAGNFIFNRQGTGGPEFVVTERFAPGGTLVVNGTVNETSSRVFKTGFTAVDPVDLLAKLVALPVTTWSYKGDRSGGTHIGPVAEDFQQFLGFGDGQSIASTDARGVMIAAIQGLKHLLDAKDAEIADVREANDALEARLAALEARLAPAAP